MPYKGTIGIIIALLLVITALDRWRRPTREEWKVIAPITVGLVLFVTLSSLGNDFVGPPRCRDGWYSQSIGRQGACSWHGGVNSTPQEIVFFVSLALSTSGGILLYRFLKKGVHTSHYDSSKAEDEISVLTLQRRLRISSDKANRIRTRILKRRASSQLNQS